MSDPMQEIRASFFIECEDLLEALQDGLTALDQGAGDSETVNVVFRAVHSIKGGAGAFGLDQLVSFTHAFENALDEMRAGKLEATSTALQLFFRCADLLLDLVRAARADTPLDEKILTPVLAELNRLTGATEGAEEDEAIDFTPTLLKFDLEMTADDEWSAEDLPPAIESASEPAIGDRYRIIFTPEPEVYDTGNEPLFLFKALRGLGQLQSKYNIVRPLPSLRDYLGETVLGWQLSLATEAESTAIEEIFEFVDGLCALSITRQSEAADQNSSSGTFSTSRQNTVAPADTVPEPEAMDALQHESEETKTPASDQFIPVSSQPNATPAGVDENHEGDGAVHPFDGPDPAKTTASSSNPTVRVDIDRIDRLVNLVGELVINQAMLAQSVAEADLPPNSPVATGLDEFQHLTRSIQESVMMIRAQPVKSLFQRMARIVRETSSSVGKDVRLLTEGEATEIDKTVIERLADPLTHMIRNAVDHGLEQREARLASGKPSRGTVTLTAGHRSGRVVIEISDDGAGIDRARVRKIAEEKGLVAESQTLTDTETDNLLFLPGFSTAKEISRLSGRGVGMDVVKSAISALGGRVAIASTAGVGTTFSISLPLTLAVLDGMVVKVAGETLVVPLNAIAETLQLTDEIVRPLGPKSLIVRVRDQFVPLLDLGNELGYRTPLASYIGCIALLIAREDGSRAALVVDLIEDQRQVVIKGLEDSYGRVPGVAAATILGDGQIALILDPVDLFTSVRGTTLTDLKLQMAG